MMRGTFLEQIIKLFFLLISKFICFKYFKIFWFSLACRLCLQEWEKCLFLTRQLINILCLTVDSAFCSVYSIWNDAVYMSKHAALMFAWYVFACDYVCFSLQRLWRYDSPSLQKSPLVFTAILSSRPINWSLKIILDSFWYCNFSFFSSASSYLLPKYMHFEQNFSFKE